LNQVSNQTSSNNIPIQDVRSLHRGFSFLGASTLAFASSRPVAGFTHMGSMIGLAGIITWQAFPLTLVLLLIVTAVLGELASRWPLEGSVYAWSRQLIGHRTGFFVGWIYLISYILLMSGMSYFDSQRIFFVLGFDPPSHLQGAFLAMLLLIVATVINASKRSFFSVFIISCAAISLIGVVVYGTLLLSHQHQPLSTLFVVPPDSATSISTLSAVLIGLVNISAFCFRGIEMPAEVAEEIRDPRRNIPRAMLISLLVIGLLLIYAAATLALALPDPASIAEAYRKNPYVGSLLPSIVLALGETAARILAAMIVVVTFGLVAVCQLAASRTLWAMARDREVPGHVWLVQLTNKERLPANALWVIGLIGAVIPFLVPNRTGFILGGTSGALIFMAYLVPIFALGVARMRGTWEPGPWSLGRWGGVATGLAFVILIGLVLNILWPRTEFYGAGTEWMPLLILLLTSISGMLFCLFSYREKGLHTRYYSPNNHGVFKRIRLAYTGMCISCENPIPAQDEVFWDPVAHQILCLDCDKQANLSTSGGLAKLK
jgi:amino acid transporter